MKRALIVLALLLLATTAHAELIQYAAPTSSSGGGGITSLTGDVTTIGTSGAAAATVVGLNGVTLGTATATAGNLLVGQGSSWLTKAVSGDCTFAATGAITCLDTNGVAFGSLATLSAAPAGTLTGTTLASGVTASSLTSVGTLVNLTAPLVIGGTATTATLTFESTSGSGSGDSIIFKTGSQVTQMTIGTQTITTTLGVGVGTATLRNSAELDVQGIVNASSSMIATSYNATTASTGLQLNGQNGISYPSTDSTTFGSIAIGSQALQHQGALASSAFNNTAVGYQALSSASLTTAAITNTAVGYQSLLGNTTGSENTAVGYQACSASTTGVENTCIGKASSVGTNTQATAIGQGTIVSGTQGTAMGWHASAAASAFAAGPGANASGSNSISFGNSTVAAGQYGIAIGNLAKNQGTNDISIGQNTGYGGGGGITGNGNIYIGYNVGSTAGSGNNNVAIGYGVGSTQLASTANFNILIGTNSGVDLGTNTASGTLDIGNVIYGTGLGTSSSSPAGVIGIGTSTIYDSATLVVNGGLLQTGALNCSTGTTTDALGKFNGCVASDQSLKEDIQDLAYDPTAIANLHPVSYRWKDKERGQAEYIGFIAQQVQAIIPDAVIPAGKGLLGVDPNALNAEIVLELQHQQSEIDELRSMKGLPPYNCNLFCEAREFFEGL